MLVSYYTLGTGYEEEVKNLIASCEKWGIQHDIVGIDSKGAWDQNCCYKPRFLLEKLEEHQCPLFWVDADAVVLQKPTLFDTLTCDIALRIYKELPLEHPSKLITGTLFFRPTDKAKKLLELWDEECQKMLEENEAEVWDQIALKRVLLKDPDVEVFPLPNSYCSIYDKTLQETPVILHYQASRLFKKEVNNEVVPFWESAAFSQQNRSDFIQ